MLHPTVEKIIYDQQKHELEIELERRRIYAERNPHPRVVIPWYVRLGDKLRHFLLRRPTADSTEPCCDPS